MNLSDELRWRGFYNQTTYKDLSELDSSPINFYFGVDPSSDSMTIGNLASAMMVRQFIDHGHKAYLLVGGATGMIGDPDGKKDERNLKSTEEVAKNKAGIVRQYSQIFAGKDFTVVDNYDWFKKIGYLEFLREVGKHVPMSQMLGREFVQSRLGEAGSGISYAEFSYALIQGYDFLHLYREHKVSLQLCGADQWGNSIAGVDLIRRLSGGEAQVYAAPLAINKATGKKFGKTEDGAIWLDKQKTSVYDFYQFWLNLDDDGVEDYLKIYTLLAKNDLESVMSQFNKDRSNRHAQKTLAYEVTKLVHGQGNADMVRDISPLVVSNQSLDDADFDHVKSVFELHATEQDQPLPSLLTELGLSKSNGQARQLIESGAISVNNQVIGTNKTKLTTEDINCGITVLRRGKNLVKVAQFA